MRYAIYRENTLINHIEADEAFCQDYCAKHSYTYEADPLPDPPDPEPTEIQVLQSQVVELQAELLRIRTGG